MTTIPRVYVHRSLSILLTADDWKLYAHSTGMNVSYQRERVEAARELNGDVERAINSAANHNDAVVMVARSLGRYRTWGACEPHAHALAYQLVELRFPPRDHRAPA